MNGSAVPLSTLNASESDKPVSWHANSSVGRPSPKPVAPSRVVSRHSGTSTFAPWGPRRALLPIGSGRRPSSTPNSTRTILSVLTGTTPDLPKF